MAEISYVITPEELAAAEAAYQTIPAFSDWIPTVADEAAWDAKLSELEQLRSKAGPEVLDRALSIALRAAAFETGVIEGLYEARGLTITVATQAAAWERQLAEEKDVDVRALFEAQLGAYHLVLDAVTNQYPVTEAWIRRLHATLAEPQDTYTVWLPDGSSEERPLPNGEYKREPNHVRLASGLIHSYAPVLQTGPEMGRLVDELRTDAFMEAHPVPQASYAHYALVAIHPFADGNGRVARALASVYTYRAARVPLLVFSDEREVYFNALEAADDGHPEPFVQLVSDSATSAMMLVTDQLRAALAPSPAAAIGDLRLLLEAQGGLTYTEIDVAALRLLDSFVQVLQETITEYPLPQGVSASPVNGSGGQAPDAPASYRPVVTQMRFAGLEVRSNAPAAAGRDAVFWPYVALDPQDRDAFVLVQRDSELAARFALRDAHPNVSIVARLRLKSLAERLLGLELNALALQADDSFKASGYDHRGHRE